MKRRAAVVIGVNAGGGLPPLQSAARTAQSVGRWLRDSSPGYDVTFLNDAQLSLDGEDKEQKVVTLSKIQDAIDKYAGLPVTHDMLVVYYCGHGLFIARHDVWLLNKAPKRSSEVVSVNSSRDMAETSGIETVVLISDACRNSVGAPDMQALNPNQIFPVRDTVPGGESSTVDLIRATIKGSAAYEIPIDGEVQPLLSYALRAAFREPNRQMIKYVNVDNTPLPVVPNRELTKFVKSRVLKAIDDAEKDVEQIVQLSIPSSDLTFIAPVDPSMATVKTVVAKKPGAKASAKAAASQKKSAKAKPPTILKAAREGAPDDLQQIKGIGPKIEDTLNSIGIFHYDQIASMGKKEIVWFDQSLLSFRGRVKRDSWISQAKKLSGNRGKAKQEIKRVQRRAPYSDARPYIRMSVPSIQAWQPPPEVPSHFESTCGFSITGAEIEDVAIGKGADRAELLVPGGKNKPGFGRAWDVKGVSQVGVRLKDGRSLLLPLIANYIGHYHVTEEGLSNATIIPSDNTDLWRSYESSRKTVERLRANAANAVEGNRFLVGSAEGANKLAQRLRRLKARDPILGLFAAWSYSEAGFPNHVEDVRSYMAGDINGELFDVLMLSGRQPWSIAKKKRVVPHCPILTQGWHILTARNVKLPKALAGGAHHLANSLYTTFLPAFGNTLFEYLEKERDK